MDSKLKQNVVKLLFLGVFVIAGLIAMRLNFAKILGAENQFFNLFQFFAPVAGGFLGSAVGAILVFVTQGIDFLMTGKAFSLLNVARLLTLVAAAWYFGASGSKKGKQWALTAIPILAIVLFVSHPVGAQAWYYAVLFWSIPVITALFFADNLFAKSVGATMTAHAMGSVLFLYTVPSTPALWVGLIPVVVYERLVFSTGTALSFIGLNALFSRVKVPGFVKVNYKTFLAKPVASRAKG
jgi:hypothetical protein